MTHMSDALGIFKPGIAFFQLPSQCLSFLVRALAFRRVAKYAHVLEIARAISSGMRNRVDVFDDAARQHNSVLDIKVHAALDGTLLELLHAITVFRVDSVEYQIESGICFMTETQNSASFFRPNELTTINLPSERSRMTQLLSLGQVLPPSLQLGLCRLQIVIGLLKRIPSLRAPRSQHAKGLTKPYSGSVPATTQLN